METNKQFDCIKLKNEIQKTILDETAGMGADELLKYFNSGFNAKIKAFENADPVDTPQQPSISGYSQST